jgi:hypothetical protein
MPNELRQFRDSELGLIVMIPYIHIYIHIGDSIGFK